MKSSSTSKPFNICQKNEINYLVNSCKKRKNKSKLSFVQTFLSIKNHGQQNQTEKEQS